MKTHTRNFRNPNTFEGAELVCIVRGDNNYAVACYKGSEMDKSGVPTGLIRGGVTAARQAWRDFQNYLTAQGFEVC